LFAFSDAGHAAKMIISRWAKIYQSWIIQLDGHVNNVMRLRSLPPVVNVSVSCSAVWLKSPPTPPTVIISSLYQSEAYQCGSLVPYSLHLSLDDHQNKVQKWKTFTHPTVLPAYSVRAANYGRWWLQSVLAVL